MNAPNLTPKQRFLRWAYPHAENRQHAGLITQNQLNQLKRLIESNAEPDEQILRVCFPNAMKILEDCARELRVGLWSHEAVTERWYNRRMCGGDMYSSQSGVVVKNGDLIIEVMGESGRTFRAVNLYQLHLQKNDDVRLVGPILVEMSYTNSRQNREQVSATL